MKNLESKRSTPYRNLCTEYYELDKPTAPKDALDCYIQYAKEAKGPILEPMCGTGRFLIPLLEIGYPVIGFDYSPYMLKLCHSKCKKLGLTTTLLEATFETFSLPDKYNLIFIPSGSFCLLTTPKQISQALKFIAEHLKPGGKFVFEILTLKAVGESQGLWKSNWVNKPNGSKIVINTFSKFDVSNSIQTTLCRYELWEENAITQTEVEDFRLRLYESAEMEPLLVQHGLKILAKWQAEPYLQIEPTNSAVAILYECIKT